MWLKFNSDTDPREASQNSDPDLREASDNGDPWKVGGRGTASSHFNLSMVVGNYGTSLSKIFRSTMKDPHLGEQLSSRQDTERHLPPLLLVQPAKGHGISAIVRRTFLNRANSASATKIITLVVYLWKKQASASTGRNSHSWAQLT